MTELEPQSTAAVLALCLIATLATAAPGQGQSPERTAHRKATSAPAADEAASARLNHYGILGAVGRPGVYICIHDDLTLAELVSAAGGTTPQAAGAAQVIRRGHTGPRLNSSPPSTASLKPGDVVVLEESPGAATEESSQWINVALVGLATDIPVVLQVQPALTELPQMLAALHQEPALIDSVRILRTSARHRLAAGEQPAERLAAGDVVVFDPATIDHAALAQAESFPPPVLISQRQQVARQQMIIQPYRPDIAVDDASLRDAAISETLPVVATTAEEIPAQAENSAEDIWPLMHEPTAGTALTATIVSTIVPPLTLPETASQPLAAAPEACDIEMVVPLVPGASESIADETHTEQQPVVATSLIGTTGHPAEADSATDDLRDREPHRMAAAPDEDMFAIAGETFAQRKTAPAAARKDRHTRASSRREQQTDTASLASSTPKPARGLGRRAVSIGIFVLVTALFCFVASLLWSRLDDSTGLPRTMAGQKNASLPIHSLAVHRTALDRLINNALPIIEEPTPLPERSDFYGEAVGRQRLRIDADQTLTGPHFAASQQTSQPVAVPASAGTANTRSIREDSPARPAAGDADASSRQDAPQGGLLDRVLVAMEREKRR